MTVNKNTVINDYVKYESHSTVSESLPESNGNINTPSKAKSNINTNISELVPLITGCFYAIIFIIRYFNNAKGNVCLCAKMVRLPHENHTGDLSLR